MLLLAVAWIVLLPAVVVPGLAVLHAVRGGQAFDRPADRLLVAAWLGLIALGVVLQAASLFVALKPAVGALIAVVGIAGALAMRDVRRDLRDLRERVTPALVLGGAALLAGVAAYVAQKVVWDDTGLYHAGAIRWLSEHGAVRGLAHIHSRFGYSSVWFDLSAPFNDGDLRQRLAAVVSGFALLLAAAQLAVAVTRALSGRAREMDWVALVGLGIAVPVVVWWRQPIAPNPDFPLVLLPVVTAWAIVATYRAAGARAGEGRARLVDARLVPLVLACGAAATKASGFALVAVAVAFYLWPLRARPAGVAVATAVVAVALAPSLTTGFVVSGCPLYPAPPCFDTAWSLTPQVAHDEAVAIRSYARRRVALPGERVTSTDWIGGWLKRGQSLFLVLTLVLGAAAAVRAPPRVRWLVALGLTGAALVLYSAPDLRFALGYCSVLVAAFALRWGRPVLDRLSVARLPVLRASALTLVAIGGLFLAARVVRPTVDGKRGLALVAPPRMTQPALRQTARDNIYYFVPADGSLCWAAPLPCSAPSLVRSDTTFRDPAAGLDGGFDHHR